jgi:hypothetical protein
MKKIDLYLFLYEKVVLALTIAAISALLLYTYNIYSKAFEVAQSQSKGYSTLFLKMRDLALGGTIKISQDVRAAYSKPSRSLPKEISDSADSISIELRQIADLLVKQSPNSASTAKEMANLIKTDSVNFLTELNFNRLQIDAFENGLAKLRLTFIENFDSEIERITLNEFHNFQTQFEKEIPWIFRPQVLGLGMGILFVFSTVSLFLYIFFGSTTTVNARRRRTRRPIR